MTTTEIDAFTHAYIETALWASMDESDESGGQPMDRNYSAEDIAPETLARMVADCERFQRENETDIADGIATGEVSFGPTYDAVGNAGHLFWLNRNGHGCGFWDGGWPEPYGDRLANACDSYGEFNLYIGDDGQIHGA